MVEIMNLDEVERVEIAGHSKEQVRFTFGKKDIAREIKSLEDIYEKRIMGRVEDILYMQVRKYQYLL